MIVVVDGDREARQRLAEILAGAGYRATGVSSAIEASDLMADADCELVISDLQLAGAPALQLLRFTRAQHPALPFVILSGGGDPAIATAALELGASGYITKPVEPNQVLIAVANAVLRAKLEADNRRYREHLEEMVRARTNALAQTLADLRSREAQLRILVDNAQDLIFRVGIEPAPWVEYVSPSAARITGYTQQEFYDDPTLLGRLFPSVMQIGREAESTGSVDVAVSRKDGSVVWVGLAATPIRDEHGQVIALEGIGRDVTMRRHTEQSSRDAATQHAAVAELGRRALSDLGLEAVMSQVVDIVTRTLQTDYASVLEIVPGGHSFLLRAAQGWPEELVGTYAVPTGAASHAGLTIEQGGPIVVDDFTTDARIAMPPHLEAAGIVSGVCVAIGDPASPYGALCAHSSSARHFVDEDVRFLATVATVLDAAIHRHRTEDNLRHRALHDELTGLPNRTLLLDHLEQALHRSQRRGTNVALLFLDVDRFKQVNDRLGHAAGDQVLQALADRLRRAARRIDTVARFGGDEFAVLCEDSATTVDAITAARRLAEAFVEPLSVAGQPASATVSVGVAVAAPGDDAASLLRHADLAMYRAKNAGGGRFDLWCDENLAEGPTVDPAG